MAGRNPSVLGIWGDKGTRVLASEDMWRQPAKWDGLARAERNIFDLLTEEGPRTHDELAERLVDPKIAEWLTDMAKQGTIELSKEDGKWYAAAWTDWKVFCASLSDVFESFELQEWATICDGYRISCFGEIQSQWRPGGYRCGWKTLKKKIDINGYETIQLGKHPTLGEKHLKVHRLMLESFVGKCPDGMVARHRDGCRSNNVLWNLSYSTQSDNLKDRIIHGTNVTGERNGRSKLSNDDVAKIRERLALGHSQSAIAVDYGVKQVAISRIKLGNSWSARSVDDSSIGNRTCVPKQIIDSQGRPIFLSDGGFSCEPSGDSKSWKPATIDDVRRRLYSLIDATQYLRWLLLTKRPENIGRMWLGSIPKIETALAHAIGTPEANIWHRPNVWLGTTCENQEYADKRIPELLKYRKSAPVLWLSVEPMLGPVDLEYPVSLFPEGPRTCCNGFECGCMGMPVDPPVYLYEGVDWVVCGCEQGPGNKPLRPMELDWARSLLAQCRRWNVPFFMKQLAVDGKVTDDMSKFPEDLRVREFPK